MMNPVFRRETQTLMRTFRTFLAMMLYVGVLALVAWVFVAMTPDNYYAGFQPQSAIYLYWALGAFQLGLAMLIAPVFAGSSISGERERQTLDLMLVTKMTHRRIILGKLASSLIVILLMIVASMPVFSIILYFGGLSLFNLLSLTAYTLLMAALSGSVAIFFSAWTKKTLVSIVASGVAVAAMTIGNLIAMLLINLFYYNANSESLPFALNKLLLGLNPGVGFFALMDAQFGSGIMDSFVRELIDQRSMDTVNEVWLAIPFWVITCVFAIGVSAVCLYYAAKCLDANRKNRKGV
ncbi:MAG: ABC transporter permease subunit [Clostridiales bacterium]|jgi:ABC-type transport system involved in multi-copper enzyme maturation permease subunit|nr:ABC transporter permease subunit [Clostridiales bacterium]